MATTQRNLIYCPEFNQTEKTPFKSSARSPGERITYLLGARSCKLVNAAKLFRTVRRLAKTYNKKGFFKLLGVQPFLVQFKMAR